MRHTLVRRRVGPERLDLPQPPGKRDAFPHVPGAVVADFVHERIRVVPPCTGKGIGHHLGQFVDSDARQRVRRDRDGRIARAGGWGFAVSDEGSGHWIGRRAISAILSAHDQGLETALTAMVLQAWKLNTLDELVQQANSTPPPDFPRLFPIVLRAADEGDSTARDLLNDAGANLACLAAIVIRRLALNTPAGMLPVAMTGSVFRQSPDVREVFYNTLQTSLPGTDVRQDIVDPIEGALARARATQ